MRTKYHREITSEALAPYFSHRALTVIIRANIWQDSLRGQIGHDEFHYDNNAIEQSNLYIKKQRELVITNLEEHRAIKAWRAMGCLTHTAQDFYAHSNYVALWIGRLGNKEPDLKHLSFVDNSIINNPEFCFAKTYFPLDYFALFPKFGTIFKNMLPKDSHAWMNLDSPESGYLFKWAFHAAAKRTYYEYTEIIKMVQKKGSALLPVFSDLAL
ncbi:MAG: HET-C-related protein [Chloroflexota bacterium]